VSQIDRVLLSCTCRLTHQDSHGQTQACVLVTKQPQEEETSARLSGTA
jgi:hypothetical protein